MKKIVLSIIGIILAIVVAIIVITKLGTSEYKKNIDEIETIFMINYNPTKINKISIYNGDDTYYIVDYYKGKEIFIGVVNNKEKLVFETEKNKLSNINEIQNKEYILGYKYDKLIYEIKEINKNGYVYSYYDAISGEFIKNINMNK